MEFASLSFCEKKHRIKEAVTQRLGSIEDDKTLNHDNEKQRDIENKWN